MVTVEEGSEVIDSIVLEGVTIGKDSVIKRSILDKFVTVGNHVRLGRDCEKASRIIPGLLDCGLSVIGKKAHIADDMTIGTNVIVYPESRPKYNYGLRINDGSSIYPDG